MSSVRGVNVGGNLFGVTDSTNIAPIETTNFATRGYAKDRCFIMADGLLYRATTEIESGDPIVINGNCKRTTLDEIISVIETDSDLIAPTEDGATSSDDYVIGDEIVRSGILYKVISVITQGDAFAIGSNIDIAGSLTSQIKTLTNQTAKKTDLTNAIITGTTNNTGGNISANRYFYLNGVLVKAKVDIPNGATFTLDTNYEVANPLFDLGTIIKNTSSVFTQGWTAASIPSGTETEITSRQLDQNGIYLVSFFNAYSNSFSQNAYIMIRWGNDSARERVMNVGAGYVGGALSAFAIVTGSSLVRFRVRQESGSTQTCEGSLKIVRLY